SFIGGGGPFDQGGIRVGGDPFRMGVGGVFIALNGDINGRADALAVQGLDLFARRVEIFFLARVALRALGVVIQMPVMALGKDGDGIDAGAFGGLGEFFGVKILAHVRDVGAGV